MCNSLEDVDQFGHSLCKCGWKVGNKRNRQLIIDGVPHTISIIYSECLVVMPPSSPIVAYFARLAAKFALQTSS